jgi:hypothetical protein
MYRSLSGTLPSAYPNSKLYSSIKTQIKCYGLGENFTESSPTTGVVCMWLFDFPCHNAFQSFYCMSFSSVIPRILQGELVLPWVEGSKQHTQLFQNKEAFLSLFFSVNGI